MYCGTFVGHYFFILRVRATMVIPKAALFLFCFQLILTGCKESGTFYQEGVDAQEAAPVVTAAADTTAPTLGSLSIATAAAYTTSTTVQLLPYALDATEMYITNTAGCGSAGAWETYTPTRNNWVLGQSNGTATVYIKFRDAAGNETACVNDSIIHDGVVPTVSSVTSAKANASYGIATVIDIDITFNEAVTVTGVPTLTLETGGTDQTATYLSGSTTTVLTFRYTVQAADTSLDLDYASTSALDLNGGTIKDVAGSDATLTLASPGAANSLGNAKAIVIDAVRPTVTVNQSGGQADPTSALPVSFTVVFSKAINAATFTTADITQNGSATGISWSIANSGDSTTFTLTATAITGEGTLIPSIAASVVQDSLVNQNTVSTTTDNSVTYTIPGPSFTITTGGGEGYSTLSAPSSINGTCGADVTSMTVISNGVAPTVDISACATTGTWSVADTSGGFIIDQKNEAFPTPAGSNLITLRAYNVAGAVTLKTLTVTYCSSLNALPAASGSYPGGTGTVGDPYQLATVADWVKLVADHASVVNYRVMNDTDFKCYAWTPPGVMFDGFKGSIDGDSKTLTNLSVSGAGADYKALIGYADASSISNLNLTHVGITGRNDVGGLIGTGRSGTTVSNCTVSGTVTGSGMRVGLLAGSFYDSTASSVTITASHSAGLVSGTGGYGHGGFLGSGYVGISDSYSTAAVSSTGFDDVGGFIGDFSTTNNHPISNSYATGAVTGANEVGGFIGKVSSNNLGSSISSSYSSGAVTGSWYTGGFIGYGWAVTVSKCYATGNVASVSFGGGFLGSTNTTSGPTISDSYATGNVSGSSMRTGGFAGNFAYVTADRIYSVGSVSGASSSKADFISSCSNSTVTDGFALSTIATAVNSDSCTIGAGPLKTAGQLKAAATFTSFDFVTVPVWDIVEGVSYPTLR